MRAPKGYERVAKWIEQQIAEQGLKPGDILPAESRIASTLGVNRSTVREALRTLEQIGLVARESGRKQLRISAPQPKEIARRAAPAMIRQKVSVQELYEAMLVIEPACALKAAERADTNDIAALEDNLARTRAALDDRVSLVALDVEFHDLVAHTAKNRALDLVRAPLSELFYPAFYPVMSRLNAASRLLVAHSEIVQALKLGDASTARTWMERHIKDFLRGYELANLDADKPVQLNGPYSSGDAPDPAAPKLE
jgi:DNA-binding FadR family transcriptional regulator